MGDGGQCPTRTNLFNHIGEAVGRAGCYIIVAMMIAQRTISSGTVITWA